MLTVIDKKIQEIQEHPLLLRLRMENMSISVCYTKDQLLSARPIRPICHPCSHSPAPESLCAKNTCLNGQHAHPSDTAILGTWPTEVLDAWIQWMDRRWSIIKTNPARYSELCKTLRDEIKT